MKKLKNLFSVLIALIVLSVSVLSLFSFIVTPQTLGIDKNPAIHWTDDTEKFVEETFGHYTNDYDKVCAFREWIIQNIPYTPYEMPIIQTVDIDKVISERKGICFEQASLFTAFCRISNIECYNVDGKAYSNRNVAHSWNRFCIDGQWYDIDITNDQNLLKKGKTNFFGISKVDGFDAKDKTFEIYRKY